MFFGLAHIHHALWKYHQHCRNSSHRPSSGGVLKVIVLETLFQFIYTSLFGAYACFVYCSTSSILDIFLIHSFCNFMGLPRFDHRDSDDDDELRGNFKERVIMGSFFLLGIITFYLGFTRWNLFPKTYLLVQHLNQVSCE
jgi:membrane protease YdiL (CAAX protease family)